VLTLPNIEAQTCNAHHTIERQAWKRFCLEITEGKHSQWVTLNHCWGNARPMTTATNTLEARTKGIRFEKLPLTFQDAVKITRELDFQYLWIDSLCILQDSPKDWQAQSVRMGEIYRDSALCIAAEEAVDSDAGIFNSLKAKRDKRHAEICYASGSIEGTKRICPAKIITKIHDRKTPLSSRAWTLQEMTLPDRVLRYDQDSVFWRCITISLHSIHEFSKPRLSGIETDGSFINGRDHQRAIRPLVRPERHDKYQDWYRIVNDFSQRFLTYESDRLPAISRIATYLNSSFGTDYKAGIWMGDIHWGLLWHTCGYIHESNTYVAPSWS
jgi:hypothetical protein